MPSPFPGMDPWLEHPAVFPDLHHSFIYVLSGALNERLPAPYFSSIARRTWVQLPDDEYRELFLEVYARAGDERPVTTILFLSLADKRPGERARDLYLRQQAEILNSQVNLVEIDLLRGGTPSTAAPRAFVAAAGPFDYHISARRLDNQDAYSVHSWQLPARLPSVHIPLLPGDPDVRIDLQPVLNRCYDGGLYTRRGRYHDGPPVPPLTPEQQTWADEVLRAAGI